MILAGDVGGTKCILALFESGSGRLRPLMEESLPSRDFASFEAVVGSFLSHRGPELSGRRVEAACFGIPGPIVDGKVKTTNLPWVITAAGLQDLLGAPAFLLNDLESAGYGIAELDPSDLRPLNRAEPISGAGRVLISAGTGLGEAILVADPNGRYRPIPSEGGHTEFAPRDEEEIGLLRFLMRKWDHVSVERVLSGPGLYNIYQYLLESGSAEVPEVAAELAAAEDPSALISRAALEGRSALCGRAMTRFVSIYGAEAGNLALKAKANGGVFVGGGIAPKILDRLVDGTFLDAFYAKGRMRPLMEAMPVSIVLNNRLGLIGAAAYARAARG